MSTAPTTAADEEPVITRQMLYCLNGQHTVGDGPFDLVDSDGNGSVRAMLCKHCRSLFIQRPPQLAKD